MTPTNMPRIPLISLAKTKASSLAKFSKLLKNANLSSAMWRLLPKTQKLWSRMQVVLTTYSRLLLVRTLSLYQYQGNWRRMFWSPRLASSASLRIWFFHFSRAISMGRSTWTKMQWARTLQLQDVSKRETDSKEHSEANSKESWLNWCLPSNKWTSRWPNRPTLRQTCWSRDSSTQQLRSASSSLMQPNSNFTKLWLWTEPNLDLWTSTIDWSTWTRPWDSSPLQTSNC